jgi:ribose transport system permease protein
VTTAPTAGPGNSTDHTSVEGPSATTSGVADGPAGFLTRLRSKLTLDNVSLLFVLVGLIVLFGILVPETFLTVDTIRNVLTDQAVTTVMALALLLPVAARQFDLSIAGNMGFSIVLIATLLAEAHWPVPVAIAATLAVGCLIGLINAFIVVRLGVNSFIATLGTGSILGAAIQWLTGGKQIVNGIPDSFTNLGRHEVLSIPLTVFYVAVVAIALWYLLEHRTTGRYVYAVGSNADAARLAGIRVNRITTIALMSSGVIASFAGILFVMRIGAASLSAGDSYLLPAFAAVFLGATQFKAGNVNVPGTIVAVLVLAVGVKGVQLIGAPFWVDGLFNGVALILAVALAVRSGRQRTML